jgi:hypothetical protein
MQGSLRKVFVVLSLSKGCVKLTEASLAASAVFQQMDREPGYDIWARFYFLPLVLTRKYETPQDYDGVHGILLRSSSDVIDDFIRVGYCQIFDLSWVQRISIPAPIASLSELPFDIEKWCTIKLL